jgi:thiol:disulfide interchange protein
MIPKKRLPTVLASLFVGAILVSNVHTVRADAPPKPVYSVAEYDPERDPVADLKSTVEQARKDNKRILIQVGGEWCGWCHLMNDYFHANSKVAAALQKDYIIMKVNFSPENKNESFLKQYPNISGYPYIFVLESDGRLLHPQDTAKLEEGRGYSEGAMLGFLKKWAPDRGGTTDKN